MINNLSQYFKEEHQFYLNNVKYVRIENDLMNTGSAQFNLNCLDNIMTTVEDSKGVTVIVTRRLKFEPEGMFDLEVSFGALLDFVPEKADEIPWHEIDLAEEFRQQGAFVLQNLMNRMTLLIGQLTSSFGQSPIILPPGIPQSAQKVE